LGPKEAPLRSICPMPCSGGSGSPATPRIRLVKLGGAAITHKATLETPNSEVISSVARHLADAFRSSAGMVVVHGAGSFGHSQAAQHGVKGGWGRGPIDEWARKGFAETRASVCKLNALVVEALVRGEHERYCLGTACLARHLTATTT
jgi:isopentenyl phosphate kinase